jgi:hypothetical protein
MKKSWEKPTLSALAGLLPGPAVSTVQAGTPESTEYSDATDRIFWFIQISHIHVGPPGSSYTSNPNWVVTEGAQIVNPEFIAASGDLTDSTNGGTIPDGPFPAEWTTYRSIINNAGMTPDFYYDIPGNHDHYNDKNFACFLNNAIQGLATGATQASWTRDFSYGSCHFLSIDCNGIATARQPAGVWLAVLITAPLDIQTTGSTTRSHVMTVGTFEPPSPGGDSGGGGVLSIPWEGFVEIAEHPDIPFQPDLKWKTPKYPEMSSSWASPPFSPTCPPR